MSSGVPRCPSRPAERKRRPEPDDSTSISRPQPSSSTRSFIYRGCNTSVSALISPAAGADPFRCRYAAMPGAKLFQRAAVSFRLDSFKRLNQFRNRNPVLIPNLTDAMCQGLSLNPAPN